MLEVKNLRKKYTTKNGVITNALDDVSLTFPETGMVFILGKSGSGKSTLLNVCGGLDKPDSGEIIIKGKSSKDFTAQDFDSYRNTYVGFVFQEYNVLNEFSVEENIALALELQNKKRDKAVIDKILADVDMREFALRKPNTLSGGQKQRVAIARALVKSPEIIMADEPTGALDSSTGKQVFDTLKNLSKEKLVLVVSHDRDFAEQYGDRIIELKDGKVISDQVRSERDADDGKKQNVRFFGADTVCVERGAELTDDDMQDIKRFLQKSGGAAVISTSHERITGMKKDMPELDVGGFEELSEQPKSKEYAPQTLIRSHLPMRHAIRVGASGLKTKPVRLVFTILLSVAAFVMFGLASTLMLFDGKKATVSTLMNSDYDYLAVNKSYYERTELYNGDKLIERGESEYTTPFTYDEYSAYADKYDGAIAAVDAYVSMTNVSMNEVVSRFYSANIDGFIVANGSLELCDDGGRLPQASDEIAISDYMFDGLRSPHTTIEYVKINSRGEEEKVKLEPMLYSDVLYSESNPVMLELDDNKFKIVGIYKGTEIPDEYKRLKKAADENRAYGGRDTEVYNWLYSVRRSGMYARIAVTETFLQEYVKSLNNSFVRDDQCFDYHAASVYVYVDNAEKVSAELNMAARYADDTGLKLLDMYSLDGTKVDSLGVGRVGLQANVAAGIYLEVFDGYIESIGGEANADADVLDVFDKLTEITDMSAVDFYELKESEQRETVAAALKSADECAKRLGITPSLEMVNTYDSTSRAVELGGVFYEHMNNCCYMSDDLYEVLYTTRQETFRVVTETKFVAPDNAYISTIFVPYDGGRRLTNELVDAMYSRGDDDSSVTIANPVMSQLEFLIMIVGLLGTVFMVIGIVLALFAFLLMFNFISASIAAKKKEIGILRAIGARTVDVFKIFLSEAMIIVSVCFAVAVLQSLATCALLNFAISANTFIKVSVFVFGPLSVLCVLGIALLTGVLATVIPVAVYGKKPPVDSIRAL